MRSVRIGAAISKILTIFRHQKRNFDADYQLSYKLCILNFNIAALIDGCN
jgi:hypothetical protein